MSSLAQEESRSISENIPWGQRKSFSDGKVHSRYKNFLGFRKGENGKPEIVEEEAKTVRKIYKLFIKRSFASWIAKHLTASGIKTPGGKDKWQKSTVDSILTNEKYKGDALLQKKFTVDFLEKKMKKNEGEILSKYRKVICQRNKKFKGKVDRCKTPTLQAEEIQMMFLNAYNTFMGNRER